MMNKRYFTSILPGNFPAPSSVQIMRNLLFARKENGDEG